MKTKPYPCFRFLLTLTATFALCLTGCESTGRSGRIQEKSAVFSRLTPAQQEHIQNGAIDFGYTQDMVYMALGQPSKVEHSPDGKNTTWSFNNYFPPDIMRTSGIVVRQVGSTKSRTIAAQQANSIGFGKATQETSMELPEMASFTLHAVFRNNKVIDLWLDAPQ